MVRPLVTKRIARGLAVIGLLLAGVAVLPLGANPAAASAQCAVHGTVLDVYGQAVPGITVRLSRGAELLTTATDQRGNYTFSSRSLLSADTSSPTTPTSLQLVPRRGSGTSSAFEVMYRSALPSLRTDVLAVEEGDCRRDFSMTDIPSGYRSTGPAVTLWPDIIEIYQRIRDGFELAEQLGIAAIEDHATLQIQAWCDDPALGCATSTNGLGDLAGFVGARSDNPVLSGSPYIVLGPGTSLLENTGRPDNREYHELGHFVHHALLGNALPFDQSNVPHGGYYGNPSSTDSWVEGFASFFSIMVSKHIDGDQYAERYRLYGAEYDLEIDHNAWEWAGWWEEFSVAGLLLDFEDGDDDYRSRGLNSRITLGSHTIRQTADDVFVVGNVRNTGTARVERAEVLVELLDEAGNVVFRTGAPTNPAHLAPGERGEYVVPAPAGVDFATARVTAGPIALSDDDPIDVTLRQLLSAIGDYQSRNPSSNGGLYDVSELYDALSAAFGGTDRDDNGIDDVDQIFIAHGFFADANGNRQYDRSIGRGETVGLTSHPATGEFPAALPREATGEPPEALVTLDTGGVATEALVYVSYASPLTHRSYGYRTALDDDDRVLITAPPQRNEAVITVVALAEGYQPTVAARANTDALWSSWDQAPGSPLPPAQALMVPGEASERTTPAQAPATSDRSWIYFTIAGSFGLVVLGGYGWVFWAHGRDDRA